MLTGERLIAREAARYWWLFLVSGILWLLIAWLVLRMNQTSVVAVGILLVLLAFWVSGSDRVYALAQRTALILFWVGFFALFRGFLQIMLAFGIRHAGQEATAVDAAGPGVGAGQPSTGEAS